MKGISINGIKLHEVQMLTAPHHGGIVSYLSYPRNRIHLVKREQEVILSIPPFLAIELYRSNILPQNTETSFSVHVSGKKIGEYKVTDFRYPATISTDLVSITMISA
jgi:hypothetical protein